MRKTSLTDLQILGSLFLKQHPEQAQTMLDRFKKPKPSETDITRIAKFYELFQAKFSSGDKAAKVDNWRLFIGAMLRMYQPQVYFMPADRISLSKLGFVVAISRASGKSRSHTSDYIRQALVWDKKNFEETTIKVTAIVEYLKTEIQKNETFNSDRTCGKTI